MTAESSWSLKGVDPKAREAARSAARKEGVTLGEWLNRRLLDERGERIAGGSSDDDAVAEAIEALSRRIEATEHRSTLAITNIDQSVLSMMSRLQSAEGAHNATAERYQKLVDNLAETQNALSQRIKTLEGDDASARNLEALKSLEAALAHVAANVEESQASDAEKLSALEAGLAQVSKGLSDTSSDIAKRIDAEAERAELHVRRVREDIEKAVAARGDALESALDAKARELRGQIEANASEASEQATKLSNLDTTLSSVSERLAAAEAVTDRAVTGLKKTFAALEERLSEAEGQLRVTPEEIARATDAAKKAAEAAMEEARLARKEADAAATRAAASADETRARAEEDARQAAEAATAAETRLKAVVDEATAAMQVAVQAAEKEAKAARKHAEVVVGEAETRLRVAVEEAAGKAQSTAERARKEAGEARAHGEKLASDVEQRTRETLADFAAKTAALEAQVREETDGLREAMDARAEVVETRLTERMGKAAAEALREGEEARQAAQSLRDDLAAHVRSARAEAAKATARAEATAQEARALVQKTREETIAAFRAENAQAREAAAEVASNAQALALEARQRADQALEELRAAAGALSPDDVRAIAKEEAEGVAIRVLDSNAAALDRLEAAFAQRFDDMGSRVTAMVTEARSELGALLETATADLTDGRLAERLGAVQDRIAKTESRHAQTLELLSGEIARMASTVERRMAAAEAQTAEIGEQAAAFARANVDNGADVDRLIDTRLREIETHSAHALARVGDEITRVAERMSDKVATVERRSNEAVESVSAQVQRLTDRVSSRTEERTEDLSHKIKASEERTRAMLDEAMQRLQQRFEDGQEHTAKSLSPVQRALASLASRLESLEDQISMPGFTPPATNAFAVEPPPFDAGEDARPARARESEERADFTAAMLDEASDRGAPSAGKSDDDAFDPIAFGGLELADEPDAPKATAPKAADTAKAEPELAPFDPTDLDLDEPPAKADPAARRAVDDETDDDGEPASDFLSYARRAAQSAGPATSASPLQPGFGPIADAIKAPRTKHVLWAAGGLAFVAVGAAAWMLTNDGGGQSGLDPAALDGFETVPGALSVPATNAGTTPPTATGTPAAPSPAITAEVGGAPDLQAPGVSPGPSETASATESQTGFEGTSAPLDAAAAPVEGAAGPEAQPEPTREPDPAPAPEPEAATPQPDVVTEPVVETPPAAPSGRVSVQEAARAGEPIAQYQLGLNLVQSGELQDGVRLLRLAAENGLAPAQFELAKLFETGTGVGQDMESARRWTERAANAGHRRAMHNLGIFLAEGRGTGQDFAAAARWFEEAALLGATDSQYNLALLYEQGIGVPLSLPDAYAWYLIAAQAGDNGADRAAAALVGRLPPEAQARAEEAARRFRPRQPDNAVNGVFGETPWSEPVLQGAALVARAQALLTAAGYDAGPADGAAGQRTRNAVIAYQRDNGLQQTGEITPALVERLTAGSGG